MELQNYWKILAHKKLGLRENFQLFDNGYFAIDSPISRAFYAPTGELIQNNCSYITPNGLVLRQQKEEILAYLCGKICYTLPAPKGSKVSFIANTVFVFNEDKTCIYYLKDGRCPECITDIDVYNRIVRCSPAGMFAVNAAITRYKGNVNFVLFNEQGAVVTPKMQNDAPITDVAFMQSGSCILTTERETAVYNKFGSKILTAEKNGDIKPLGGWFANYKDALIVDASSGKTFGEYNGETALSRHGAKIYPYKIVTRTGQAFYFGGKFQLFSTERELDDLLIAYYDNTAYPIPLMYQSHQILDSIFAIQRQNYEDKELFHYLNRLTDFVPKF